MGGCSVEAGGFGGGGIDPLAGCPVSGLVFDELTGVKATTVDL